MQKVYNFAAGPSMLPEEVLIKAQSELLNCNGTGCSVMEMSHRSSSYLEVFNSTKSRLTSLMNIPEDYEILFLQGGATTQFSAVPMNLAKKGDITAYAVTGTFASKALKEAKRWTDAYAVSDSSDVGYSTIYDIDPSAIRPGTKYLHITGNNTTCGTMYHSIPKDLPVPIVADWSSAILGTDINVSDYDLIYAGAQKNIGIAGVTIVIVKKSILDTELCDTIPPIMRYTDMIKNDSMLNTPPTFAIYMCGLVLEWLESKGGVKGIEKINLEKSKMLYDYIDSSEMYTGTANVKDRSTMNVTFTLPDEDKTKKFLELCKERDMINLAGYRTIGGVRASIYNAMPVEGVERLLEAMRDFEKNN